MIVRAIESGAVNEAEVGITCVLMPNVIATEISDKKLKNKMSEKTHVMRQ